MANLENYHTYHKCRSDRLGGDVSLLIHDSVKLLRKLDSKFNDSFESITAELLYKGQKVIVSEIY